MKRKIVLFVERTFEFLREGRELLGCYIFKQQELQLQKKTRAN